MSGGDYFSSIWRGIYKTSLIKNNGISFRNIKFAEDLLFNIECIDVSESICVSDKAFYHYMDNEESSLKKLQHNPRNAVDFINELGKCVETKQNNKVFEKIYISELIICLERIINIAKTYVGFKTWVKRIEIVNISESSKEIILVKKEKYFRLFLIMWIKKIKRKLI